MPSAPVRVPTPPPVPPLPPRQTPPSAWPAPLQWQRLRRLDVPATEHPRGQPHVSAASGLVCAFGRVFVVADDEHHLVVFSSRQAPGRLHRLIEGDLPRGAAERKARKADLETLALLPAGAGLAGPALLALGSGSAPGRDRAVWQPLSHGGEPVGHARVLDLGPLYQPLRERLGGLNIEGAIVQPSGGAHRGGGRRGADGDAALWLFHRGGSGARGANVLIRQRWRDVRQLLQSGARGGLRGVLPPAALLTCELGGVRGVGYGFTDAVALPAPLGGGCLFTAVAEDSTDAVADGACVGSAIGCLGADGALRWLRPLRGAPKVEGIDVLVQRAGLTVCLATDTDDPLRASELLIVRLPARPPAGPW